MTNNNPQPMDHIMTIDIHITFAHAADCGVVETIDIDDNETIESALRMAGNDAFDVPTTVYNDDTVEMTAEFGPATGKTVRFSSHAPLTEIKSALLTVGLVMTWGDDLPPHTRGIPLSDCPEWHKWCADNGADWFAT